MASRTIVASQSKLLSLRPEIRNEIYHLVLVKTWYFCISDRKFKSRRSNVPGDSKEPGFLRVRRQIRKEASPVYYGMNVFYSTFVKWPGMNRWLDKCGTERLRLLRNVRHDPDFSYGSGSAKKILDEMAVTCKQLGLGNPIEGVRITVRVRQQDPTRWYSQAELQAAEAAGILDD